MSGDHPRPEPPPRPAGTVAAEPTRAKLENHQTPGRPLTVALAARRLWADAGLARRLRGALAPTAASRAPTPLQVLERPGRAKRAIGAHGWPSDSAIIALKDGMIGV
jgi:hypothetical protein